MYRFAVDIKFCRMNALRLFVYVLVFNFTVMLIITIYVWTPSQPLLSYTLVHDSYPLADTIDTSPPTLCMFTTFKSSQKKMPVFNFYDVLSFKVLVRL